MLSINPPVTVVRILRLDDVEFATRDGAAAKTLYTAAFDWTFTDYGPNCTAFTDGPLSGSFFADRTAPTRTTAHAVLFAADLESSEQRILAAGCTIMTPIFEFPGASRSHFTGPTGLEFSVWSDQGYDSSVLA